MAHKAPYINDAFIQRIAESANADPRSVIRRLAGLKVRGRVAHRIDRALAQTRRTSTESASAA